MQQVLARKNVQKTTFKAAEMTLGPWNQRRIYRLLQYSFKGLHQEFSYVKVFIRNTAMLKGLTKFKDN